MKIAMVSEHASPLAALGEVDCGGQNLHVAELSAALVRLGHEVTVYTRKDSPELPQRLLSPQGFTVVHVPAGPSEKISKDKILPYMRDFASFLVREWAQQPPDIVHAHFWMSGLASIMAAGVSEIPVAQTFHALGLVKRRYQGSEDISPAERISAEHVIGKRVNRVIATCTDEVFELLKMGIPRSKISVVPCGVDLRRFTPVGYVAKKHKHKRLVSVGRLVPRKGFDVAISALRQIPDAELVIAGGPEQGDLAKDAEAARLVNYARAEGVADRVSLVGQVLRKDMPALLRSADIVVCTPWYEPFGIVPLEAMACGVPVIAAAVGGLVDTVVDGVTGRHVPARNPRALARASRALLAEPALLESYGMAARDRVAARYSWDRVAVDMLRAYARLGAYADVSVMAGEAL